ncbi:MAG: pyruvate kinase [Gemmatimonadales bacterium]
MGMNRKKLDKTIAELESIRKAARKTEKKYATELAAIHPSFRKSATNLIHYLALRHQNLDSLQDDLERLGVSRLAKAESHVMASLVAVERALKAIAGSKERTSGKVGLSIKKGTKRLGANTTALLGKKLKGCKGRIMVTLPSEAADDKKWVAKLVASGMNSARINCAHDDVAAWKRMVSNIEAAKRKTGRNCKVCMDLGGPKLRTGPLVPGPQVVHIHPERDPLGVVTVPARVWLGPNGATGGAADAVHLPVDEGILGRIPDGAELRFQDTRGKSRKLQVERGEAGGKLAVCYESAFVTNGTELALNEKQRSFKFTVGALPPLEQTILLSKGDLLILHSDPRPGEPAQLDASGDVIECAHVSCTLTEVFEHTKPGEPILFDDGKVEGVIQSVSDGEIHVEITYAKNNAAKLRSDKGINLPESQLETSALTEKDRRDLLFVSEHADVVNLSFVNGPEDVFELYAELDALKADTRGVILKIETQSGFKNLPAILLAAMSRYPVGVMIARGDLAIEGGWKHLAQIQEEILKMCEAAHVPVVWATQVLETLAKKGRPARAEITDAAMAQRAECVMLNKGPHILETIQMLEKILKCMESYHRKQAPMLPPLDVEDVLTVNSEA